MLYFPYQGQKELSTRSSIDTMGRELNTHLSVLGRLFHYGEDFRHSRVRAVDGAAVASDGQAPVAA